MKKIIADRIEWTFRDRAGWGSGQWDDEPDKVQWRYGRFDCLAVRNPMGAWCGYVGVPEGHPLHGVGYSEESEALKAALERRLEKPVGETPGLAVMLAALTGNLEPRPDIVFEVHGGITYSDFCQGGEHGICHGIEGEHDRTFWFGFDCSHSGDLTPKLSVFYPEDGFLKATEIYRDLGYVREQVHRLADQLAEIS